MKVLGKVIFHLLPLIPLYRQNVTLALAALLFVALAYIKVFKLQQQRSEQEQAGRTFQLSRQLRFWLSLTFLKAEPSGQ